VRVLCEGVIIDGRMTLPARVVVMDPQPDVPPRDPPVRVRKSVQDFWLELRICEGRNRQVRRMTAAIGHPTIRLIRVAFGGFAPRDLTPGMWRELTVEEARSLTRRPG
jgi:23S rRNA pseudouridine2457 synthase